MAIDRGTKVACVLFLLLVIGTIALYCISFFATSEPAIVQDKIVTDLKGTPRYSLIVKTKDGEVVTSECLNDEYSSCKVGDTIEIKFIFLTCSTKRRAETLIDF